MSGKRGLGERIKAAFWLVFSFERFKQMLLKEEENEYQAGTKLRRSMASALRQVLQIAGVIVLIAVAFGKVCSGLPADPGKVLSMFGGCIAGWATLFQLGDFHESHKGQTLSEQVRNLIFKGAFLLGMLIAGVGQLWWV